MSNRHPTIEVFSLAFLGGIQPGTTFQELEGPDQAGLLLCVPDVSNVPDKVKTLKEVLKNHGIETEYAPLVQSRISSTVPRIGVRTFRRTKFFLMRVPIRASS